MGWKKSLTPQFKERKTWIWLLKTTAIMDIAGEIPTVVVTGREEVSHELNYKIQYYLS